jgi:hypothetical protein
MRKAAQNKITLIQEYKKEDDKLWSKIKNSFDKTVINRYLNMFSERGQYLVSAQNRLDFVNDYFVRDSIQWKKANGKQYKRYYTDYLSEFSEHGLHVAEAVSQKEKIENKYNRKFMELVYSSAAPFGIRVGGVGANHWGGYAKFQTSMILPELVDLVDVEKYGLKNSISAGVIYALRSSIYLYGGAGVGFYKDSLHQVKSAIGGEVEGGLQFNLGGLSLSAGLSYSKIGLPNSYLDYNLGIGFNIYNSAYEDGLFVSLVNSSVSPVGLMLSRFGDNFGGYLKYQMPLPTKEFEESSPVKKHGIRYAVSAGPALNITSWLSVYGGLGMEFWQDNLKQRGAQPALETEGGLMFHNSNAGQLTIGLHKSRVGTDKSFVDYDIGFALSPEVMSEVDEDMQTIIQLSSSTTAQLGIMNEVLFGRGGFYVNAQTTIPSKKFIESNSANIKHGIRHSFLVGPVLAYTDFLSSYAGVGMGLYNRTFDAATYTTGFEVETGLNISLGTLNLSGGLHWCKVGTENQFRDYNFGLGIKIPDEEMAWHDYYPYPYVKYIYNSKFPFGLEMGGVGDWLGGYGKGQLGKDGYALTGNISGGVILNASAFLQPYFGIGTGTDCGFEFESGISINLYRLPFSAGIKFCKVGTESSFLLFDFGIGFSVI